MNETLLTATAMVLQHHPLLTILLICHFLTDFQLQPQTLADQKYKHNSALIQHFLIVALPLVILTIWQPQLFILTSWIFLSHALIDFTSVWLNKKHAKYKVWIFIFDQLFHLLASIGGYFYWAHLIVPSNLLIANAAILRYVLVFVLISKPTNILFKIAFVKYQPKKQNHELASVAGAGALIGLLERLTIALCIIFGQFASIGLVFTAKSIARYNKISEEPLFAEYYLIGSLYSILSVLVIYLLCIG